MVTMKLALLACCLLGALALEFTALEGKLADPCNKVLDLVNQRDCPPHSELPTPSNTVLIPSANSPASVTGTLIGAPLLANTFFLWGNQIPRTSPVGSVRSYLALSTTEGTCRLIDNTFVVIPADYYTIPAVVAAVGPPAVAAVPASNAWDRLTFILGNVHANLAGLGKKLWNDDQLMLEDRPRLLCWTNELNDLAATDPYTAPYRYTGFKIGVVFNCDNNAGCGLATQLTTIPATLAGQLTPLQRQLRIARTVCCKRTTTVLGATTPLGSPLTPTVNAGQCINPFVQDCCGSSAFEIANQKCCNPLKESVSHAEAVCPCSVGSDCPMGENCCLPTKYNALTYPIYQDTLNPNTPKTGFLRGQCYKPTRMHCCDTGSVFDPGSHQCCRINGIQSLNVPCPCGADADCVTAHTPIASQTKNFTCCQRTIPTPLESGVGVCDIFANYPTGQGVAEAQRCAGNCMDPRYQVCCNGAICMNDYERCCNASCCNMWSATCFQGYRPGAPGSRTNNYNFGPASNNAANSVPELYEVCSEVEHVTTLKGFWIWVLPSILLLASHVGLALVLVFAAKATPRSFSKLEFFMMGLAFIISYLAMPLYFSPIWKYPIFIIFGQLLVFLTASARIRWLNVMCVVVQVITLIYVFDPFHGNAFLTLSVSRGVSPQTVIPTAAPDDFMFSGLLHSISHSWHSIEGQVALSSTQRFCVEFYDWFLLDPKMRDVERYDNGEIATFGYCTRGWTNALMMFSYFVMMGVLIQLILSLLGVFIRFRKDTVSELEEEYEPQY